MKKGTAHMKKIKRILALTGAILLIGLYACTLIFTLIGTPLATDLLKASVAVTILLPVLLYGFQLVWRLMHKNDNDTDSRES